MKSVKMRTSLITAFITMFTAAFALLLSVGAHAQSNVTFLNPNGANSPLPFSEAVKVGDTLILSGQIGFSPTLKKLVEGGLEAETRQTLDNIKATLARYDYSMKDVVKCTVILADIKDFAQFNGIYKEYFAYPYPARTTFAASGLALNAQIEIECLAAK